MHKTLTTNSGRKFYVSIEDYDKVSKYTWWVHSSGKGMEYLRSTVNGFKVYLHRFIMSAPKGFIVDHINLNTFDNTRSNLRFVDSYVSNVNTTRRRDGKFRGVTEHRDGRKKKWCAKVYKYNKVVYREYFYSKEQAEKAYKQEALKHHGR